MRFLFFLLPQNGADVLSSVAHLVSRYVFHDISRKGWKGWSGNIMKNMKKKSAIAFLLFGVMFFITSPRLIDANSNNGAYIAWYMYPITQPYNVHGERGEDLGTPEGTPITSLVSGQLVGAGFYGGGGVVTVRTTLNGHLADFYVQHLDSIVNVRLCQYGYCGGQYVHRGELLGYSGGDCNWHYGPGFGRFNACASKLSDGSHIEVGINPPWYGIWGPYPHPGRNYNPYSTILALINEGPYVSSSTLIYVVRQGDTLTSIALKYHVSWYYIYQLNRSAIGANPNRIYPGEKLRVG
jgi:nucleoid-associated protein YgaU